MKNLFKLAILTILSSFLSCNPKVTTSLQRYYEPLAYDKEVYLINIDENIPEDAEILGEVKVGDSGFTTRCTYEVVVDEARLAARKIGGNAIKITEHLPPSILGSSCHRIKARILKINNIEALKSSQENELLDINHALLHVYRPGNYGFLVTYDLYLGDSVLCRVKSNYKTTIPVYKEGYLSLWAKTESKTEIPITLKPGREYYIRCGIGMGLLVGRPTIELVDNTIGKSEYLTIKQDKKGDDQLIRTNGEIVTCRIIDERDDKVVFEINQNGHRIKTELNKTKIEKIIYATEINSK